MKSRISETLSTNDLDDARRMLQIFVKENQVHPMDVAAALMLMVQGVPMKAEEDALYSPVDRKQNHKTGQKEQTRSKNKKNISHDEDCIAMECYRIELGRSDGVAPGNIVGAIANETGLEGKYIGRIAIEDEFSTVDLPVGMPAGHLNQLKKAWIAGKQLKIHKISAIDQKKNRKNRKNSDRKRRYNRAV